jgi:hypothetical protein
VTPSRNIAVPARGNHDPTSLARPSQSQRVCVPQPWVGLHRAGVARASRPCHPYQHPTNPNGHAPPTASPSHFTNHHPPPRSVPANGTPSPSNRLRTALPRVPTGHRIPAQSTALGTPPRSEGTLHTSPEHRSGKEGSKTRHHATIAITYSPGYRENKPFAVRIQ